MSHASIEDIYKYHELLKNTNITLGIDTEETDNEQQQCVICFKSKKNIKFNPCGHNHTCSLCYVQILKPRECPFCKQEIESIEPND